MSGVGSMKLLVSASMLAILVAGCSPIKHSHGYSPRADELDQVVVGQDTRDSVQRKLGRPSTVGSFDSDEWYYISMQTEQLAFFEPQVVSQKVVTVTFDDTGAVTDVGNYGLEDGKVIDLVSRTTPTSGAKLTLLQQIFQNVGRYGNKSLLDAGGSTGAPGG